jgi:hypothetical protein
MAMALARPLPRLRQHKWNRRLHGEGVSGSRGTMKPDGGMGFGVGSDAQAVEQLGVPMVAKGQHGLMQTRTTPAFSTPILPSSPAQ